MLGYYLRLALKSFARTPGLTALMVGAIGLGISTCVIAVTVYHAMGNNPIWWKNDRLYAVTMDLWDPVRPADPNHPGLPPPQLSYPDAKYLLGSDIPTHKVMMFKSDGVLSGGAMERKPVPVTARVTTSDFFAIFDVPFQYGGGWNAAADTGPEPVIVLSRPENQKLFGGSNSVGRTIRWNDREFRIVGVLDEWMPQPKYYDLNNSPLIEPEEVYIPFGWGAALSLLSSGNSNCWHDQKLDTYEEFMASDCIWLQMWVELPGAARRERMQTFMDNYWTDQHKAGRFPRPRNNRLTNVSGWLRDNDVIGNDNRVLLGLAFAFLAVCIINTIGLLLAKFMNGAPVTGVRRALGASRLQVFVQHQVEAGALAVAGAALGVLLSALGMWAERRLFSVVHDFGYSSGHSIFRIDSASLVAAIVLSVVAALAVGIYPAWRIGLIPPAKYLKAQ